ncbi:MAG: hypothetical protein CFH34_01750 [Alphaproteobacteria bacterium MarineAlpha9_Bin4]|nr:hypothetical protein [Pelagibacterales bacterium]PPR24584.1 MAG: hypothetical protein CFH34_01750 [Alphaproteobacteria bacterium MarineAlpha9_Bin4]
MGYFVIIVFTTFLGAPPEFLPIAFKNNKDCVNYLTKVVIKDFNTMKIEKSNKSKYLTNQFNNKFIVCKKLEYPIIKTNF